MMPTLRSRRPAPFVWLACLGLPVLLLGPSLARASDDEAVQKREIEQLQGVWTLESMEIDGRKADVDSTRGWFLVIRGDQYNPGSSQTSVEYTYRIDPERNPKAIDLIPHDGSFKGRQLRGIYVIKGDRLTICRARTPDGERPAGFSSRVDSGLVVTVWKRRKR
ncbi:MAG: TIGR03067 domain-containing protein [Isosphaeraceae bacterium]